MDMIPFQFQSVALQESCWIDGTPFFTRRSIGEWLEYKYPQEAVDKIVRRNPHIDDPRWSTQVKLTSVDQYNLPRHSQVKLTCESIDREREIEVSVHNPIGLQLIVFESRQPKAIAYKIAVANLVWDFMNGKLKPSKWSQKGDLVAAGKQIHSIKSSFDRGEILRDLAEREGCSLATIYRRINRATGKRIRHGVRCDRGRTRYPGEKRKVFQYKAEHPDAGGTEIKKAFSLTVSASRINAWLRTSSLNHR